MLTEVSMAVEAFIHCQAVIACYEFGRDMHEKAKISVPLVTICQMTSAAIWPILIPTAWIGFSIRLANTDMNRCPAGMPDFA